MPGFVKIYGDRLLRSTLWVGSDPATKVVWITMLALSDQNGKVTGSLPGLAHTSNVSLDETSKALDYFRAPDPHSQTKDHEGRRIEDIDGGWLILNYSKYREYRTEAQVKEAARKQKWRESRRAGRVLDVLSSPIKSRTEAEAEADPTPPPRSPPNAGAGKNGDTWMTPFIDLHYAILGGKMQVSKWVRTFRPLVDEHGEATVFKAQRHYLQNLRDTNRQDFLDYHKWAESFGTWLALPQQAGRPTRRVDQGKDYNA